mmetsp:Transcript_58860/g.164406  ORF Transcript_58860/g.164406 Transcript_58860/m.164406 type:complete len:261 (-) Transcript_58860:60-842(-)
MPTDSFARSSCFRRSSSAFSASFAAFAVPRPFSFAASSRGSSFGFAGFSAPASVLLCLALTSGRGAPHSGQAHSRFEASSPHVVQRQLFSGTSSSEPPLASSFFRTQRPFSFFTMVWSTSPRCKTWRPLSSPLPPKLPWTPQPTVPGRPHLGPMLPSTFACSGLEYSKVSRPQVFFLSNISFFFLHSFCSSSSSSPEGLASAFESFWGLLESFRSFLKRAKGVSNWRCLRKLSSSCSQRALSGSCTGVKRDITRYGAPLG